MNKLPQLAMARGRASLIIGGLLILLIGCSSNQPTYQVDYDPDLAFGNYRTYRWYDDVVPSQAAEYRQYNGSDERIRDAVDTALKRKGFRKVTGQEFDFLFNYRIAKQHHETIESFNNYGGGVHGSVGAGTYGRGMSIGYSSGPRIKSYAEGTAVLDIIDEATGNIVWRGVASGRLKKNPSLSDKQRGTIEVVNELLADFPPQ